MPVLGVVLTKSSLYLWLVDEGPTRESEMIGKGRTSGGESRQSMSKYAERL